MTRKRHVDIGDDTPLMTTEPECYKLKVTCGNCEFNGTADIPKGLQLAEAECPECGCRELKRKPKRKKKKKESSQVAREYDEPVDTDAATLWELQLEQQRLRRAIERQEQESPFIGRTHSPAPPPSPLVPDQNHYYDPQRRHWICSEGDLRNASDVIARSARSSSMTGSPGDGGDHSSLLAMSAAQSRTNADYNTGALNNAMYGMQADRNLSPMESAALSNVIVGKQ